MYHPLEQSNERGNHANIAILGDVGETGFSEPSEQCLHRLKMCRKSSPQDTCVRVCMQNPVIQGRIASLIVKQRRCARDGVQMHTHCENHHSANYPQILITERGSLGGS